MRAWGLIVAAGRGERLGAEHPKAFTPLGGRPMVAWSLQAFGQAPSVENVVVVVPDSSYIAGIADWDARAICVEGGSTRQASVRAGLGAIPPDAEAVVVHDAARPLVTAQLIEDALAGLSGADGAIVAVPVTDTLKRVEGAEVAGTASRDGLWRAQTPQAFTAEVLRRAHDAAAAGATDDAALVEAVGGHVVVVEGSERNIKVTTKADLEVVEALMRA